MPGQGHQLQLEDNLPRRLRSCGNGRDIFAMVKLSMSDRELCQLPLLVHPESMVNMTQNFWNNVNRGDFVLTQSLDPSRAEELNQLANRLELNFPHMARGARYLKTLTQADRRREPLPRLQFVDAGPSAAGGIGHIQLGRPPPPPKPYKLQVVFHHRANWWIIQQLFICMAFQIKTIYTDWCSPRLGSGSKNCKHAACSVWKGFKRSSNGMLIADCHFHFYKVHLQVFGFRVRDWDRLGLRWPISVMTLQAMLSFRRSGLSLTLWDPYWFLGWISMIHSHLRAFYSNMYQWLDCYNQTPRWSRHRTSGSMWTTIFLSIPCRRQCWNTTLYLCGFYPSTTL